MLYFNLAYFALLLLWQLCNFDIMVKNTKLAVLHELILVLLLDALLFSVKLNCYEVIAVYVFKIDYSTLNNKSNLSSSEVI
jgi:hypothetical protein